MPVRHQLKQDSQIGLAPTTLNAFILKFERKSARNSCLKLTTPVPSRTQISPSQ